MTKQQLLQRAEWIFEANRHYPELNWQKQMYYTLFLWAGYKP
jgi:hypothetical protein